MKFNKGKVQYIIDNLSGISFLGIGVILIVMGLKYDVRSNIFWGLEIMGSVWFAFAMLSQRLSTILKTLGYYKPKEKDSIEPNRL